MVVSLRRAAALVLSSALALGAPGVAGAAGQPDDGPKSSSLPPSSAAAPDTSGPPGGPSAPGEEPFTPTFSEADCPVALPPDVAGGVHCGLVTVPLEHDDPSGPTIELATATFPASDPQGGPPILMLAGGPGERLVQPVLEGLTAGAGLNPALHATRDFVLLDQRGVGASRPALECPEVFDALLGATDAASVRALAVPAYAACAARLEAEGVDLSAFDTANDVEDVDMVREALGYEQVHLFGTSYGARLALKVAGAHPEGVASAVLSSPVPGEANFVADVGASYDRVLLALDEACAEDPACAAFAPGLLETFEATLAELEAEPATVEVVDPVTGEVQVTTIDAATLSQVVYSFFYAPGGPAVVPALIAATAEGNFDLLLGSSPALTESPYAYGVQASFLCAEEAVDAPPAGVPEPETLAARLLLASNPVVGAGLADVCEVWDVEPEGPETFAPVVTDVPVLVVTGEFDQITPPSYGRAIAEALPDATYVEVPGAGHSPLFNAGICGAQLMLDFVEGPGGELDTSCLPAAITFLSPEQVFGPAPGATEPVVVPDAAAASLLAA
jgi:pimeloyl-ACP methyl ester carboxylesterase